MKKRLIQGGTIINEGERYTGYVVLCGERIEEVGRGAYPYERFEGEVIDAQGRWVLPGVIDDQVHFREPGLTHKADIGTESRAAVAGGVTSFMEMPNTNPTTTTREAWEAKMERAAATSQANYAFYFGATNDNIEAVKALDPRAVCGVKVFMGSSTGNMLVNDPKTLSAIFSESPVLVATHCEQEEVVRANLARFEAEYGTAITPAMHPLIRSAEACYRSTAQAVELAERYGSQLHVLHLSTARELDLFSDKPLAQKNITNEVCVHHLWFSEADYATRGNWIKWTPAIKSAEDRAALRAGLLNGKVDVIATDHAPHTREEKLRPYLEAPSGGPLVQFSLVAMLSLAQQGVCTPERVVELMCHAPAQRFGVEERGYLRAGYYADVVIVDPAAAWELTAADVLSRCAWSPMEGVAFQHRVTHTFVNGSLAYDKSGIKEEAPRGQALRFSGRS